MFQDEGMPDLSDTDLHLNFEFEGDIVLEGYLNRIHAPLIVEEIQGFLKLLKKGLRI